MCFRLTFFFDGILDDGESLIITVEGLPDACGDVEVLQQ
jgi:hypothetical protein